MTDFRRLAIAAFFAMALPIGEASADLRSEVFTLENRGLLCSADNRIESAKLMRAMFIQIENSGVLLDYLGDGDPNKRRQRFFVGKEPIYLDIDQASDAEKKIAETALKARRTYVRSFARMLGEQSIRPHYGYFVRIEQGAPADLATAYFQGSDKVRLICEQPSAKPQEEADSGPSPYRVRGAVDDLTAKAGSSEFKAASSAAVSYTSNDQTDEESFLIEGAAGYVIPFSDPNGKIEQEAILFAALKNSKTTVSGASTDEVRVVNLGVLFSHFGLHAQSGLLRNYKIAARPTLTLDREQDAEEVGVKFEISPGLKLGGFTFNQDNDLLKALGAGNSPVLLYPAVRFLGEANYVADAGSNPKLMDDDGYAGVGVAPVLQLGFFTNSPLDRLRLTADYRYVELFSAPSDTVSRYDLGAEYRIDDDGNIKLRLEYIDGEDPDTFQDEKFWGIKLTLKL